MEDIQALTNNGCRDAGNFADWLESMRAVLRGERDADVPCGDCVGCCVSSYQIPLRPTDRVALERVPSVHLHLPADAVGGLARMGFREDGTCPMLCAGACSIYRERPQTCRDYDCRIYAATGMVPDGDRPAISKRVHAWAFTFASEQERGEAEAVRRAARFIRTHADQFPPAMRTNSATAVAVLAVKTQELFLDAAPATGGATSRQPSVQHVVDAARAFDRGQ